MGTDGLLLRPEGNNQNKQRVAKNNIVENNLQMCNVHFNGLRNSIFVIERKFAFPRQDKSRS